MLVDRDLAQTRFDRIVSLINDVPNGKLTRPSTILDALPIVGGLTTFIIQTYRNADTGEFAIFLQTVDSGEQATRIIIPNKVTQAIYRQRQSLVDRSTPASRAKAQRARTVAKKRADRAARQQRYQERIAK